MGDYAITEAGFGADLGAEKFLDIKCRMAGLTPDAVVVVATVRALKHHGGVAKADLNTENLEALERGLPNLLRHVENITKVYGLPCVVAINRFPTDTEAELKLVEDKCRALGVNVALSEVWGKGGEGGLALAEEVVPPPNPLNPPKPPPKPPPRPPKMSPNIEKMSSIDIPSPPKPPNGPPLPAAPLTPA